MSRSTPVLRGIGDLDADYLQEVLTVAPSYDRRIADAIGRTIRCIHGLEDLHETAWRDDLAVYLGRATETTLKKRWREHASGQKRHQYGTVLFTCSGDRVEKLESIALKVLRKLKDRGILCVGNANCHPTSSGGAPRPGEVAIIYMTWTKSSRTSYEKPGVADIRDIAWETAAETPGVTPKQLETGLATLKRLTESDALHWWSP